VAELAQLRDAFAQADTWLAGSPLYQALAGAVRDDPALLELAGYTRSGPLPLNMLMSATHLIVLRDPSLPFARFFPSVYGDDAAPADGAGAEYAAFCEEHRGELIEILSQRFVQTNVAARSIALRLALHEVARRVSEPVILLEIGASAGILLCFDRFGVDIGGRSFGPPDAKVRVEARWISDQPVPDLDDLPEIEQRLGVDLHPVSTADADDRRWLRALIWPEHRDRLQALDTILDVVAQDPPSILAGDAADLLPQLALELPAGVPIVVFHSMVRVHVPIERRPAFDAAIDGLAGDRRLLHVSFEGDPAAGSAPDGRPVLQLADSGGPGRDLAFVDGHSRCIEPLNG
jgi:hypothetical protein